MALSPAGANDNEDKRKDRLEPLSPRTTGRCASAFDRSFERGGRRSSGPGAGPDGRLRPVRLAQTSVSIEASATPTATSSYCREP